MHYICGISHTLLRLAYFQYGYHAEIFYPFLLDQNQHLRYLTKELILEGQVVYLPHDPNKIRRNISLEIVQKTINYDCSTEIQLLIRGLCQAHLHPYIFSDILNLPLPTVSGYQPTTLYLTLPRSEYHSALQKINQLIAEYPKSTANMSFMDKYNFAKEYLEPAYNKLQKSFDEALGNLDYHLIERLKYAPTTDLGFHTDDRGFGGMKDILSRVRRVLPQIYAIQLATTTFGDMQPLAWRDEVELFLGEYASNYLSDLRLTPVMVLTRSGWVVKVIGNRLPFLVKHTRDPFYVEIIKGYGRLANDLIYGDAKARAGAISEIILEVLLCYTGGLVLKGVARLATPAIQKLATNAAKLNKKAVPTGLATGESLEVESSVIRQRVLSNIAESRAGRTETNVTNFTLFSRKSTAIEFYSRNGFEAEDTLAHMRGIDFTKPVQVETLEKGTPVVQYMLPNRSTGNYFAPLGTSGNQLGLYTSGRTPTTFFATQNTSVLRSTASAMVDDYSMAEYEWLIETQGGGTQYFSPIKSVWKQNL